MTIIRKVVIIISIPVLILIAVYIYAGFLAFDLDEDIKYRLAMLRYPRCEFIYNSHTIFFKNEAYADTGYWNCSVSENNEFTAYNVNRNLVIKTHKNIEDINTSTCSNKVESINSNLVDLWYCYTNDNYGDIGKAYIYIGNNAGLPNNSQKIYVTVTKNSSKENGIEGIDSAMIMHFLGDVRVDGQGSTGATFWPRFTGY